MRRSRMHKTEEVTDICRREVAQFYGLTVEEMEKGSDEKSAWARSVLYLVLAAEEFSAGNIAEFCDRDERTVKFGMGRVAAQFAKSPGVEREIKQIVARCGAELDKFWEAQEKESA